jgi:hypothetical protein
MLRRYHRLLWSKPLPNGEQFELQDAPRGCLRRCSNLGEFLLASDSAMQTFTRWEVTRAIIDQLPPSENEFFQSITYTIGGMMIWPANQIGRKWTMNQARGCNWRRIGDRLDLTLEAIRRHYRGDGTSPLAEVIARYGDFFALFRDFAGFIDFLLLDDLVTEDREVRFFMPFDDFSGLAYPQDLKTYLEFRNNSIAFVEARNRRIAKWASTAGVIQT